MIVSRHVLCRSAGRFALLMLVAVVVAALAAGAGAERASGPRVSGGSPAQRALLQEILGRMGSTSIKTVRVARPPRRWGDFPRNLVDLQVRTQNGDRMRSAWETWLLAGAFRDLSKKRHLPPVLFYEGQDGGARIGVSIGPPPASSQTAAAAAELEAQVRAAVADTATVSSTAIVDLRILRPYGLAFALVLRTDTPATVMRHQLPALLARLRDPESLLDGAYFALQDAEGVRVWETGFSARAGAGGVWTRPDLEGCNPIVHSYPVGATIPPCPAP